MIKVLFACLMCLVNWCHSDNFKFRNSLEAFYLPDIIERINLSNLRVNYDNVIEKSDVTLPVEYNREGRHLCKKKKKKKWSKHTKYLIPLIVGWLLIKSILLPMALKALALIGGKALVLSLMSLILAAIMGLKKLAHGGLPMALGYGAGPSAHSKYNRQDYWDHDNQSELAENFDYYDRRPLN